CRRGHHRSPRRGVVQPPCGFRFCPVLGLGGWGGRAGTREGPRGGGGGGRYPRFPGPFPDIQRVGPPGPSSPTARRWRSLGRGAVAASPPAGSCSVRFSGLGCEGAGLEREKGPGAGAAVCGTPVSRAPSRIFNVCVRRCPALPHARACSTIGAEGLSFRVRN